MSKRKNNEPEMDRLRATLTKDAVPYFEIPSIDGRAERVPPKGSEAYEQSLRSALSLAQGSTHRTR